VDVVGSGDLKIGNLTLLSNLGGKNPAKIVTWFTYYVMSGTIGYPRDKVAAYMYDLVEKFANNNKQSKVSEVIFVVHYKDPKSKQVISLTVQSLYSESSIF
jgi:hypothetical protein